MQLGTEVGAPAALLVTSSSESTTHEGGGGGLTVKGVPTLLDAGACAAVGGADVPVDTLSMADSSKT